MDKLAFDVGLQEDTTGKHYFKSLCNEEYFQSKIRIETCKYI